MTITKNCLRDNHRLVNYIFSHTSDKNLRRLVYTYNYSIHDLKVIANDLRKPKPVHFTRTKGYDPEPDLFR